MEITILVTFFAVILTMSEGMWFISVNYLLIICMPTQCLLTMKFVVTVYPDLIGCAWLKRSNLWICHVHGILIVFFVKTSPFPSINVASMTILQLPILLHDIHCWCHKYHPISWVQTGLLLFYLVNSQFLTYLHPSLTGLPLTVLLSFLKLAS